MALYLRPVRALAGLFLRAVRSPLLSTVQISPGYSTAHGGVYLQLVSQGIIAPDTDVTGHFIRWDDSTPTALIVYSDLTVSADTTTFVEEAEYSADGVTWVAFTIIAGATDLHHIRTSLFFGQNF